MAVFDHVKRDLKLVSDEERAAQEVSAGRAGFCCEFNLNPKSGDGI